MQNIIIPNKQEFELKLGNIIKDGKENLHIVSDFDRTLTKAFVKGQKSPTVIAQIRNKDYLGEDYVKKAHDLYDFYHPIELDNSISKKEKINKMHEWWKKHFDLLIEKGLNKHIIDRIVSKKSLKFRKDLDFFLKILSENKIPLVIISAAPGDMIKGYLIQDNLLHDNIHIISNFFNFDKNGNVESVKPPIIHSLNKHEVEIKKFPIFNELNKRKNIILLGDGIDDLGMVEGFSYKNIIKIGFLNENQEENLEVFKKNFDVVIINDAGMDFVNEILEKIV